MCRVLVVEDEDDVRQLMTVFLEAEGHTVEQADTGLKGLKLALATPFDVLVVDERIPDLRGSQMYNCLCQRGKNIPAVLVTASSNAKQLALQGGFAGYLEKPFDISRLLDSVKKLFDHTV